MQLRGAGPAKITRVREKSRHETLLSSFTLWHFTLLWWVSYLKNIAWPKAGLGIINAEFKACIWGPWSQSEDLTLCCTSCLLGRWMKGWRLAPSFCVQGAREARKGSGHEENTRMKLNPATFTEFRGHSLVWGNAVLFDYNVWLAGRAWRDRAVTATSAGWKKEWHVLKLLWFYSFFIALLKFEDVTWSLTPDNLWIFDTETVSCCWWLWKRCGALRQWCRVFCRKRF